MHAGRGWGEFLQRSASFIPSWAVLYKTVCCVDVQVSESICFGRAIGRPRALRRVRGRVARAIGRRDRYGCVFVVYVCVEC